MRILYISTNFTSLTHSFITREIAHLQGSGVVVGLLSLRSHAVGQGAEHPECDLQGCRYAYPVPAWRVMCSLVAYGCRRPGRTLHALGLLLRSEGDNLRTRLKLCYQLGVAATCIKWVESGQYQHIHAHFASSPTSFALCLHLLTDIPFSFTGHAADIFREGSALRLKLRRAAGVVCISEYNQRYYESLVGPLARWRLIRCGVDVTSFPYAMRNSARTPLRILSVGRLVPKKGFSDLLAGVARLVESGIACQLDIVGDGPLRAELERRALELGLSSESVVFHGPLQQIRIRELLDAADVFALMCVIAPDGDRDNIPVSLMEAMAVGCPVVSTAVAAIPELVAPPSGAGILLPEGDVDGLARALAELARDADEMSRLSRGGRSKVERDFNLETENAKLRNFFLELAGSRGE